MFIVLLLSACLCASALSASATYYNLEDAPSHFEDFINKYNKQYVHDKEKEARFNIFVENLKDVNQMNNASEHTVYGITKFMDLTAEEFKNKYTGFKASKVRNSVCKMLNDSDVNDKDAPDAFDWRDHKAVTPVKFQGFCGSCYSFSSTGHIEGQYAIKHGNIVSLSEQQIVDCDNSSSGCFGGYMSHVYSYLINIGGIELESDYRYIGVAFDCKFDKNKVAVVVKKCYQYNLTTQEKVKQLLHKVGPISIAIDASKLQSYTGGIFDNSKCQGDLNHAVLLVGYGSSSDGDFWIVKNSWAKDWGEEGYFRMERKEGGNSCKMFNDEMTSVDIA